jgi:solute:Na+ symporter, SSS family
VSLPLLLIFGYSALQIAVGLWLGRRVRNTPDFFVAGRRLGPGLLFATLIAANIGAGSTVGASGLGYRDGLSSWWWVGSAGLGSLVLALWVGPLIRRIAAEHGLHTVGDYLEFRYDRRIRGIVAALLWVGTLAILAGQLIAVAWVLDVVAGLPKYLGCFVGGAVMTTYFAAGGLMTAAWVNTMQLVLELTVFSLLVPLSVAAAGGWQAVAANTPQIPDYWSFWQGGASGWTYLAALGPSFVISPGLLQKVYGARDDRAVRIGVGTNAALLLVFAFFPVTLGMVGRALHPGLVNPELALPTVLMKDLPPLAGALGLAAIFSTEVNTADAILFMLATSLSQDLYRRFVNPGASDRRVLAVARLAAVAGGALGVALAILAPSVIDVLKLFYTVLSVCLFVPLLAGLYLRRVGPPEALAAIASGVAVMLAVHLATGGRGLGGVSPALAGIAAAALGCAAVALVRTSAPTRGAATGRI